MMRKGQIIRCLEMIKNEGLLAISVSEKPMELTVSIRMSFGRDDLPYLQRLPWYKQLEKWKSHEARFLQIKSGLSRHPVRFVRVRRKAFAIKETSGQAAGKEIASYARLRQLGIPTLLPVGSVERDDGAVTVETEAGAQLERRSTG